jgi:hypothetical protein
MMSLFCVLVFCYQRKTSTLPLLDPIRRHLMMYLEAIHLILLCVLIQVIFLFESFSPLGWNDPFEFNGCKVQ